MEISMLGMQFADGETDSLIQSERSSFLIAEMGNSESVSRPDFFSSEMSWLNLYKILLSNF